MNALVYIYEPIPFGLDELEDAIDDALNGIGNVTGTGSGAAGSNIDVLFDERAISEEHLLKLIKQALAPFQLPNSTSVVIAENRYLL